MPNTPAQFPNFDLPGAEWFALAPNANIAIQGRRRMSKSVGAMNVDPGSSNVSLAGLPLETNFIPGSAIFVHHASLKLQGAGLTISGAGLFLNVSTNAAANWFPLGNAFPASLSANQPILVISDRDVLVTQRDLMAIGANAFDSFGGNAPGTTLNLSISATGVNAGTAAQSFQMQASIVYTVLTGLTE